MNKLSGYSEITLKSGRHVEFKICNGSYSIYAKLKGFATYDEVVASLQPPMKEVIGDDGKPEMVPVQTFDFIENMQLFVFSCAKYAAQAQNKPVDFTPFDVGEWLEEIGADLILEAMDSIPEDETNTSVAKKKTKTKKPLIRPSQ